MPLNIGLIGAVIVSCTPRSYHPKYWSWRMDPSQSSITCWNIAFILIVSITGRDRDERVWMWVTCKNNSDGLTQQRNRNLTQQAGSLLVKYVFFFWRWFAWRNQPNHNLSFLLKVRPVCFAGGSTATSSSSFSTENSTNEPRLKTVVVVFYQSVMWTNESLMQTGRSSLCFTGNIMCSFQLYARHWFHYKTGHQLATGERVYNPDCRLAWHLRRWQSSCQKTVWQKQKLHAHTHKVETTAATC